MGPQKTKVGAGGMSNIFIIVFIILLAIGAWPWPESCCDGAVEVQVKDRARLTESELQGLTMVTAYCPCEKCCGEYADGYTASGHKIEKGERFVAAPPGIEFNTMVIVPGYNNGRAVPVMDRGGAIKGNHIDVFLDTHEQALQWGVQFLPVEVICQN